ncbi:helix-hairpin-helix domain-containing protein [Eubacterium oxidoreducens]|uniref:Competence protein ComEA n=1 Tax=Eubacterium oxidoreducens TaxID=1732 RepID=A0A1G6B5S0_EUBOX|nr:helix-hairpin-helix domain-containing protein [Eubacterium oxidoreducens]SDB16000.1 competence protein ComEA [Eubacterium oxidoreducens]
MKRKIIVLFIVCCIFAMLTGCCVTQSQDDLLVSQTESTNLSVSGEDDDQIKLCVYVCGAVKSPGVYTLKKGARIYEAVELAGGLTGKAQQDGINLAEEVTDGQMVVVPVKEKTEKSEAVSENTADGKVNINSATKEELMTLSGIGEAKAQAIITYREENGLFSAVEDLVNVSGIADGTLNKIKDSIKVN